MATRDDWETPPELFGLMHERYHFTVDACAHERNKKLYRYWSKEQDGLEQPWAGERVWCNPPYGVKEIPRWIDKAVKEQEAITVMLLPSRTEMLWFADLMRHCSDVEFLRRRVPFWLDGQRNGGDPKNGSRPTWASLVAVFDQTRRMHAGSCMVRTLDWRDPDQLSLP